MEQSTNISNSTLEGLEQAIVKLKIERKARILKVMQINSSLVILPLHLNWKTWLEMQLKDIVASLFELWNLMDSPKEEKNNFSTITSILRSSDTEITELGVLSTETIEQVQKHSEFSFVF